MKKQPASKSAFFNPGILIDLASCSIGLLALLAFALYTGGNALAEGSQQNQSGVQPQQDGFYPPLPLQGVTPTPTPTSTPTPPNTISISGKVGQCTTAGPSGLVLAGATMTLTGTTSGSTTTDGSGNYSFSGLTPGGNYTVTPTKAARPPGSAGIDTRDVAWVAGHPPPPLLGDCRFTAADVTGFGGINTVDVIAIQRFSLGLTTGIAHTGMYQFSPTNRSYTGIVSNQTGQNYDTVVLGDVASPYVH